MVPALRDRTIGLKEMKGKGTRVPGGVKVSSGCSTDIIVDDGM